MLELLTRSGAIIHAESDSPAVAVAVAALGGIVASMSIDDDRETVLTIMDQAVIGTTLADADGTEYLLTPGGWYAAGADTETVTPNHESIISATMPGGWSWSA